MTALAIMAGPGNYNKLVRLVLLNGVGGRGVANERLVAVRMEAVRNSQSTDFGKDGARPREDRLDWKLVGGLTLSGLIEYRSPLSGKSHDSKRLQAFALELDSSAREIKTRLKLALTIGKASPSGCKRRLEEKKETSRARSLFFVKVFYIFLLWELWIRPNEPQDDTAS
ncbi:predicted protein [Aspergillus nidulans FGSC A4]|uniref:Uncharacterized protein n=1 Tax=Emericella nidulans (strain FGSC A4 / ATCC 38163 / CBS 112.46 / NRRL 194 / M139) TaxID=227321 RepID=Q5B7S4_EMENI|nr:hypothetical protein [Aspergillus nidulans FGSC A4]EAA63374.1 predicted protein [Aspergillus nidulans FGSC A4]CBF82771.1 TPA: hypothetical protein ANIA_03406 [Aspergillus nidulans FGSC A4]|eukprot:XP_661010.1 predicted protein [Aspergillus nidulans FGSC A4]